MKTTKTFKKFHFILALMSFACLSASAQLKVTNTGNVLIGDTSSISSSFIMKVGCHPCFTNTLHNLGVVSSVVAHDMMHNVGVEGNVTPPFLYGETNIGVRGLVNAVPGITHGRNYGVAGFVNGASNSLGGVGVFGSGTIGSYLSCPNVQGHFAGYFDGNVRITNTLTVPTIVQPSDIRLKDNVVSLADTEKDGLTLEKLLRMNVIEYNLKTYPENSYSEGMIDSLRSKHPEAFEFLEEQQNQFTSQLHYGLSAQELQTLYPNLVYEGKDGYLAVNYLELVPILIRSIQELKAELDELKGTSQLRKGRNEDEAEPFEDSHPLYPISVNGQIIGKKRPVQK